MIHFQSGIWVSELSRNTTDDPTDIPCAKNYKAWTKRFTNATEIPIKVYIMCPHSHMHTWESIFPNDNQFKPAKLTCDFSTAYSTRLKTPCGQPLFRNVDPHIDGENQDDDNEEDHNGTKYKPLLVYPVFDVVAQLRSILKRPDAYAQLTAYRSAFHPTFEGVRSEVYHGEAFQKLWELGFWNDNPLILDLFIQVSLDWAQFSAFGKDKIGPVIGRVLNYLFPGRFDDDKM